MRTTTDIQAGCIKGKTVASIAKTASCFTRLAQPLRAMRTFVITSHIRQQFHDCLDKRQTSASVVTVLCSGSVKFFDLHRKRTRILENAPRQRRLPNP
jgi:hypothetical protein